MTREKPMKCKNCGSADFIQKNGMYVCQYCGSQYPIPEDEQSKEDQPRNRNGKKNAKNTQTQYFQNTASYSQNDEKSGYVDASPRKTKKKRSTLSNILIVVVVVIVILMLIGTWR